MSIGEILAKINPVPQQREMSQSEYNKLVDTNTKLIDKIKDQEEEIERLNNIINELEESLKDDKEEYNKDLDLETKELYNEYWRGYSICADKNLDYLQELKGDGSNE